MLSIRGVVIVWEVVWVWKVIWVRVVVVVIYFDVLVRVILWFCFLLRKWVGLVVEWWLVYEGGDFFDLIVIGRWYFYVFLSFFLWVLFC